MSSSSGAEFNSATFVATTEKRIQSSTKTYLKSNFHESSVSLVNLLSNLIINF